MAKQKKKATRSSKVAKKKVNAPKTTGKKPKSKATSTRTPPTKGQTDKSQDERKPGELRYWLVKSEPYAFSIDDLAASPKKTTCWDGVRNYQARNFMRDEMQVGDLVLFYHSNAEPPGIAGICKIVRGGYVDHTAFDPQDKHFDPKSNASQPRWYMVDVKLVKKFRCELSLPRLRETPELEGMMLLQRGSRLSVQPVSEEHFHIIKQLADA